MDTIRIPPDFSEFLKLLREHRVDYLLIGGYAVGYHGYPRSTGDMDVWVSMSPDNAVRLAAAVQAFGFADASAELLSTPERVIRMGVPPLRLEILTSISGVEFADAYGRRIDALIDGVPISIIALEDLKTNKRASGRLKDLSDVDNLP
jgi:hypothetical protein